MAVAEATGWRREAEDAARAAAGGMLFGIPLLYTMEVWWIGSFASPLRMLVVLAMSFLVLVVLNRTGGFRTTKDIRLVDAAMDSVEALAIAFVCVAAVLVLLRELTGTTPIDEAMGKVIYESAPFVVGVGFATHFLRRSRSGEEDGHDGPDDDAVADDDTNATLSDIGGTVLGATFVSFAIAPTDEVPMIGAALSAPWVLALLIASLVVSYVIVFEAGFSDEKSRRSQSGVIQHPATETVVCYLLSLVTAAALMLFFGRVTLDDPFPFTLTQVIVLGLPAAIGGAAGRLVV